MNTTIAELMIRRKDKAPVPDALKRSFGTVPLSTVASMLKNMEAYGYSFTSDAVKTIINSYSEEAIIEYWKSLEPVLKQITGADKEYNVMYPNFPKQVMDASDAELFINAIVHYLSSGTMLPDYEKKDRVPIKIESIKHKLSFIEDSDLDKLTENLITSSVAWSEQDKADFTALFNNDFIKCTGTVLSKDIPNKENMCAIVSIVDTSGFTIASNLLKTATDVLRYITYLSGGDVSLATNTRFKNLPRSKRTEIMAILDDMGFEHIIEDMWRYRERWIRIGEIIHPTSYSINRYDDVIRAFQAIRNNKKPLFFAGKVEQYLDEIRNSADYDNLEKLIKLLKTRPGEFGRRLDYILRELPSGELSCMVLVEFSKVSDQIAIPVLFQIANHFKNRNRIDDRVVIPKGLASKAAVLDNHLPRIREEYCEMIVEYCNNSIVEQLKSRSPLGKVYFDLPDFDKMMAPFALRSANSGSRSVVRGSRFPVEHNFIRLFAWWTNGANGDRIDVDLSAIIYDKNMGVLKRIAYYNLKEPEINCCHSGDITNGGPFGGKGAAEFIDIDIDKIKKVMPEAKYVAFSVTSFTTQTFNDYPCHFGWMNRNYVDSGEIFEPATVEMRINLSTPTTYSIPAILDLTEKEVVWTDLAVPTDKLTPINVDNNSKNSGVIVTAITNLCKTTMADVISLNVVARSDEIVVSREEADTIFSLDTTIPVDEDGNKKDVRIITPWDIDVFCGELM